MVDNPFIVLAILRKQYPPFAEKHVTAFISEKKRTFVVI